MSQNRAFFRYSDVNNEARTLKGRAKRFFETIVRGLNQLTERIHPDLCFVPFPYHEKMRALPGMPDWARFEEVLQFDPVQGVWVFGIAMTFPNVGNSPPSKGNPCFALQFKVNLSLKSVQQAVLTFQPRLDVPALNSVVMDLTNNSDYPTQSMAFMEQLLFELSQYFEDPAHWLPEVEGDIRRRIPDPWPNGDALHLEVRTAAGVPVLNVQGTAV